MEVSLYLALSRLGLDDGAEPAKDAGLPGVQACGFELPCAILVISGGLKAMELDATWPLDCTRSFRILLSEIKLK